MRFRDAAELRLSRPCEVQRRRVPFAIGFVKKVLIADRNWHRRRRRASRLANRGSRRAGSAHSATRCRSTSTSRGDMAVGLGLLLGFHFPSNFRSPYRSVSITEFWRRAHQPLHGVTTSTSHSAATVAQSPHLPQPGGDHAVGGLWHGAQWTFLLWGAWQGLWLCVERKFGKAARLAGPCRCALHLHAGGVRVGDLQGRRPERTAGDVGGHGRRARSRRDA